MWMICSMQQWKRYRKRHAELVCPRPRRINCYTASTAVNFVFCRYAEADAAPAVQSLRNPVRHSVSLSSQPTLLPRTTINMNNQHSQTVFVSIQRLSLVRSKTALEFRVDRFVSIDAYPSLMAEPYRSGWTAEEPIAKDGNPNFF